MNGKSGAIAVILRLLMFGGCFWWWECSGLWGDDEFQRYAQRTDRMTMTSGDAKEVNATTHMLTPWPPGVGDRRILADGQRMQGALDRYRKSIRTPDPMPDVSSPDYAMGPAVQEKGSGSGNGGGGAAPAPYQGQ
jgi:hypothetical protein